MSSAISPADSNPFAHSDGEAIRLRGVKLILGDDRPGESHPPVEALRGVDLTVRRGERVALTGPSGSGKTSLLTVVAGLQKVSGGEAHALGKNLSAMSEDELAEFRRVGVGIIFQHYHLIPTMTALENAAMPLELAKRPDAEEAAMHALESVGLAARAAHYPRELSGGEQQRVAVARAFVHSPPLLLADEPTGNLDSENGIAALDALFSLAEKANSALLLVTHDSALLPRFSRVVKIRDGIVLSS